MAIRAQLPVRSPLDMADLGRVAAGWVGGAPDPRPLLRERLAQRFGAEEVILTGSGTQALTLALRGASRLLEGPTPVLLPAFTCFDVAAAAVGADVQVLFYDLDPATLAPDLDSLRRGLEAGARIAVVNPLYGLPLPWDEIRALVDGVGGILVEDAAQGAHGRWRGRWLGSLGDLSVLSFGRGKGWTGAGGGALLARGPLAGGGEWSVEPAGPGWRTLAKAGAMGILGVPAVYGVPRRLPFLGLGETHYHPPAPPGAMGAVEAALILASEEAAESEAGLRRRNAAELARRLAEVAGVRIPTPVEGGDPGFLRFPVLLPPARHPHPPVGIRFGIGASYPIPLPRLEPLRSRIVGGPWKVPGAEELSSCLITLPTHSGVSGADREGIVDALSAGAALAGGVR